jgi:hypothetical protein
MARPKRFELLTPRFVVYSHPLKSFAILANRIELITCGDKGLDLVCKPFPGQVPPPPRAGNGCAARWLMGGPSLISIGNQRKVITVSVSKTNGSMCQTTR